MKLTKKGLLKIVGDIVVDSPECLLSKTLDNWNRARDFDQDDFEDVVMLTVEEAKRVQSALYELLRNSNDKNSREWLTYWMINGRIEQAEMSKQST